MAQLFEPLLCKPEGQDFDSRWDHCDFLLSLSFRAHYVPGVDSAPNRNKSQGNILGVKAVGVMAENLATFMCGLSRISGGLKHLDLLGAVQTSV